LVITLECEPAAYMGTSGRLNANVMVAQTLLSQYG
jgi:hypothetical protein